MWRPPQTPTRRTVITTIGGAAIAGGGLLTLATGSAEADLTVSELTAEGQDYQSEDGTPYSPFISISGQWYYNQPEVPHRYKLILQFGKDGGDYEGVDTLSASGTDAEAQGTYDMGAPVVEHSQWSATDWDAPTGQSITRTVPIRIVMELIASDASTMAVAKASDDLTLQVTSTGEVSDAFVHGQTSVHWMNSSSDTPAS